MDYKEEIKKRLTKLSDGLKNFIKAEDWRDVAKQISDKSGLNGEQYASLENEIFLVLLCFEFESDFIENLRNGLQVDEEKANQIAIEAENNIFSKVSDEIDESITMLNKNYEVEPETQNRQNNVGSSFEQIILNQAKAMQPAVASPKLGYGEAKPAQDEQRMGVSPNLHTEQNEQVKTPNYSGQDPYREPLQ